jgi:hypothetical protein
MKKDSAWTCIDGMWIESGYLRRQLDERDLRAIMIYKYIQVSCLVTLVHAIVFGLIIKYC